MGKRWWKYTTDGIQCLGCKATDEKYKGVNGIDPFTRFNSIIHAPDCPAAGIDGGME